MMIHTPLCDLLGIAHPVILGGMMGVSDGRLTAAVSESGGLGTISGATYGPQAIRGEIETVRARTDKPFAVNFPIFHPMVQTLVDVILACGVKIVVTSAGSPTRYTRLLKNAGLTVLHVVSSVKTARKAADAGVDAVVAEGYESGGKVSPDEVPAISLIPQVVDAVDVPVIGAGGLADGRGLLAVLALGAQAAQFGTRFIATTEAPVHDHWKQQLIRADDAATGVACRHSSPTRLIRNRFFEELDALDEPGKKAMDYFPFQGEGLTRIPGDPDGVRGNYTAGTGSGLVRKIQPAGDVVHAITAEADAGLQKLKTFGNLR